MGSTSLASDEVEEGRVQESSEASSSQASSDAHQPSSTATTHSSDAPESIPPAQASSDDASEDLNAESEDALGPSPASVESGDDNSHLVNAGESKPSELPDAEKLRSLERNRIIPKQELGKQCTIVYSRHGQKNGDRLTSYGHQQVEQLSVAMQKFEHDHQKSFDYIFHSNYKRSIASAKPFLEFKNKTASKPYSSPENMQQLLREVDATNSAGVAEGRRKAPLLLEELKRYCKSKPGATLFVSGHGNMGVYLFRAMGISRNFAHEEAGPYVLTSDDGESFDLDHWPSKRY